MSSTSTILDKGLVVTDSHNKKLSLSFSKTTLVVKDSGRRKVECPLNQVLWTEVTQDRAFRLSLLHRQKHGLALWKINATFDPTLHETAVDWTESLMDAAYEGRKRSSRLKVMINPHGGPGRARSIFDKKVKPIFEAANCTLDVMVTEYYKHCYEHTKSMGLDYDAVVLLSGDGLVHEVFNAFSERDDAADALAIPVVQIPTGSANGLSLCILGLKDGHDVCAAALNAIKGQRMKIDLCSVQQEGKRAISFMSQAVGMLADVDLGTEHLRWMGDTRFMVGLLREIVVNRPCPVKLEIQVAARDKKKMVQTYRANRSYGDLSLPPRGRSNDHVEPLHPVVETSPSTDTNTEAHTEDRAQAASMNSSMDEDGWIVIDKPLLYVYAGKLPYVSRDFMQFPLALADDGFIDIVAQEHGTRVHTIRSISGAAEGKQYWGPTQHYFKARAYRVTPLTKKGNVSIDGEKFSWAPFQVEIHPRMGTTLGGGGWQTKFNF